MTEQELKHIIQSCRTQEASSQKKLYQHFYNYAMTVCSRYAQNREEAKEIMNDGFVKVFKKIDQYSGKLSFKAWLNKIMVNTAIDHFRKNKKLPRTVDLIHAQHLETSVDVIARLSAQELLLLVQGLSPTYRMVFSLFVVEGFTHKEIAEELGIKVGTSKSNLAKARLKLKAMLQSLTDKKSKYG